jgi:hypothetical protein
MGATGVATTAMKNQLATNYASTALYLTLLKALTLQTATSVGASSFSVDLSVQAGDVLVFEQGGANQETATVASVTGAGPYTVTPVNALTKSHATSAKISHVPVSSTTVHELTVTRTAASWGSASGGVITSAASAITVSSGAGNFVGSLALYSASTAGTYYDATPVAVQDFTATSGSYTPVWVETVS